MQKPANCVSNKTASTPGLQAAKPKPDIWGALVNNVLKNPFIWGMALTYFFIYVVRQVGALGRVWVLLGLPAYYGSSG